MANHPGRQLRHMLAAWPGSQTDFAAALGISRVCLNLILRERRPITVATALALERMSGTPAEQWVRAQIAHDLALARAALKAVDSEEAGGQARLGRGRPRPADAKKL